MVVAAAPADVLLWKQLDGVAVVTLNRPDRANAINGAVAQALEAAIDRAEGDSTIRAVILASARSDLFCGGADLAEVAAGRSAELSTPRGGFAGFVERDRSKPWIAAVNGPAVGGGCELVLACEMVVATPEAAFALPEVRRGLLAGGGGLLRLLATVPPKIALEAILTGAPIPAERAQLAGFVNRLVPADRLHDAAIELALAVAAASPAAVEESLRLCRRATNAGAELRTEVAAALARLMAHPDSSEGVNAFLAKRAPCWAEESL